MMRKTIRLWAGRLFELERRDKQLLQALSDAAMVVVAMLLAHGINGYALDAGSAAMCAAMALVVVGLLLITGAYRAVVRYLSFGISPRVVLAIVGGMLAFEFLNSLSGHVVRQRVVFDFGLMALVFVSLPRHVMRWLYESTQHNGREAVLIYGAGSAGRQLAMALRTSSQYALLGFIDEDPALKHAHILSLPVRPLNSLKKWVAQGRVRHILLAMPNISVTRRRDIIASLEPLGVSVQTVPDMGDLVSGRAKLSELRHVDVADLLGREAVPPMAQLIQKDIAGKVVMVTGAGGSIGSELCRQILQQSPTVLVLLERSEHALYTIDNELRATIEASGRSVNVVPVLASVCHGQRVRDLIQKFAVDTIYHAAAYKHVPLVENNAFAAIRNNVVGTWEVALAAAELRVRNFVLVSTDKAVRPSNVMGATKRLAELAVQALAAENSATRFSMVRFGNVLGSSGSVVPRFRAQIAEGGPVTVTHPDVIRYFMTIPEAAQLVIQAGAMGGHGEVFVLEMGEPVNILQLAQRMIRLSGLIPITDEQPEGDIEIRFTGLRPGEKLYEELLLSDKAQTTDHPRICHSLEPALPLVEWKALLGRLCDAMSNSDLNAARQIFHDAPLQYQPSRETFDDVAVNGASKGESVVHIMPVGSGAG